MKLGQADASAIVFGLGCTEFRKINCILKRFQPCEILNAYQESDRLAMTRYLNALMPVVCPVDDVRQVLAQGADSDRVGINFHPCRVHRKYISYRTYEMMQRYKSQAIGSLPKNEYSLLVRTSTQIRMLWGYRLWGFGAC